MEPNSPNVSLDITIILETPRWADVLPTYQVVVDEVVGGTLVTLGHHGDMVQVSVVLADDEFLRRYNKQYRDKDHPTNVLSFPADKSVHFEGQADNLGDILVSLSTLEWEAAEQSKTFEDHFKHMLVHGVLHLLGYDHQTDEEADKMEGLEITILQSLGVANPYER